MPTSVGRPGLASIDRKSTRLNSSHLVISYAVFCLKKKLLCFKPQALLLEGLESVPEGNPAVPFSEIQISHGTSASVPAAKAANLLLSLAARLKDAPFQVSCARTAYKTNRGERDALREGCSVKTAS